MSRHRSPSGRRAHSRHGADSPAVPGARPRHASAHSALRNSLTAAAVAGGALALGMPSVAVSEEAGDPTSDAALLRLTTEERSVAEATSTRPAGPALEIVDAAPAVAVAPADLPTATNGVLVLTSVVPVAAPDEPEPPEVDAAELLKAVGLADIARKAEEERAARAAAADCDTGLGMLGQVKPWVRSAAQFLSCLYDEPTLIGVAQRARHSDHPAGLAVDFMMRGERGDRLAECALRNRDALGVNYVIWKQRINYGDGWERMSDRGGDTANHYDHVHVSFDRQSPGGRPAVDFCA